MVSTKHYQAKTDFFSLVSYHEGKKACVPDLKRGKDTTDQSAVLSSRAGQCLTAWGRNRSWYDLQVTCNNTCAPINLIQPVH